MAIVIPELILKKVLDALNDYYWNNYLAAVEDGDATKSLLYDMFGGLQIENFNYFDEIVEIFKNNYKKEKRPIKIKFGWNPEQMGGLNVSLLLPNEETIAEGISILDGQTFDITNESFRYKHRYPYAVTYALMINSVNANEVMLLYHYFKTILISGIEQLELNEFKKIKISGKDHTMEMDIMPLQGHTRTVDISFLYTNETLGVIDHGATSAIAFDGTNEDTPEP